jgi:hypothetical protein
MELINERSDWEEREVIGNQWESHFIPPLES